MSDCRHFCYIETLVSSPWSFTSSLEMPCVCSLKIAGPSMPTPSTVGLGSPHLQLLASVAVLEEGSTFEEILAPSAVTGKPHSRLASPPGTITAEPVFPAV